MRFYDPQSGVIRLDGVPLADLRREDFRAHMALVPQDPVIFAASAMDNIRFGRPGATDAEAREAAQAAAAHEFIAALPQGYDTAASRGGRGFSGPIGPSTTAGDYADPSDVTGGASAPADGGDGYDGPDGAADGGMIGHYAQGGLGSLGGYSDGGRLLRGPGDGVSDSIPATVGDRQPARLADGEFVVPARIVSELGNGSTEAGARALYKMMDRIQANRRKTTGKNSVAVNSKSHKYLPA